VKSEKKGDEQALLSDRIGAFRLALRARELATTPYIPMLKVNNVRRGFVERHELTAIVTHLPTYLHAVLTLTVDRVDLQAASRG
jgi:hypothetical protein